MPSLNLKKICSTCCRKKESTDKEYQKLFVAHKQVEASFKVVSVSVTLARRVGGVDSNIVKVLLLLYAVIRFYCLLLHGS